VNVPSLQIALRAKMPTIVQIFMNIILCGKQSAKRQKKTDFLKKRSAFSKNNLLFQKEDLFLAKTIYFCTKKIFFGNNNLQ
jgi:hypothetical protein